MIKSLRVIFMGTPHFALPALQKLYEAGHHVIAVYSQPPKPQGRGYQLQKTPIHQWAESFNIPVFTPQSLRSEEECYTFKSLNPDVAIVAAYGLILPKAILTAPVKGCINIHGSLLPRWRGAAPIQRAIEAGDADTGITIMQMDEGLDTGDILSMEKVPIDRHNAQEMHDLLALKGAKLLLKTLDQLDAIIPQPQPKEGVTYASKLRKEEGVLDWRQAALLLDQKIRAFTPWPGCYFRYKGEVIKVLKAQYLPLESHHTPGTIVDRDFKIACGSGVLEILEAQRAGKKPLLRHEFLRGIDLSPGCVLDSVDATL